MGAVRPPIVAWFAYNKPNFAINSRDKHADENRLIQPDLYQQRQRSVQCECGVVLPRGGQLQSSLFVGEWTDRGRSEGDSHWFSAQCSRVEQPPGCHLEQECGDT